MAIFSEMTMNWLRPVIGLVAQPAAAAKTTNGSKHLKNLRMAPAFYGGLRRADVTECFRPGAFAVRFPHDEQGAKGSQRVPQPAPLDSRLRSAARAARSEKARGHPPDRQGQDRGQTPGEKTGA